MRFVALLRGVNVGGANPLPMAQLRGLMEGLGFADVGTVGASGNVLFDASGPAAGVAAKIERALAKRAGKPIPAIVRSRPQLRKIAAADPFPSKVTDDMRLAVTFLRSPSKAALPGVAGIDVVARTPGELFTVWRVAKGRPPAFHRHEKALGVATTTRFWSVVRTLAERIEPSSEA